MDRHTSGSLGLNDFVLNFSVQDVFRWQMEVAEDVYDTNTGRIVWSIEYTRNGISKESYLTQDSKIISQINIHNKDQQRLVPVLKVTIFPELQ